MEKVPTEFLSLAGEYGVASELCKSGIYAQLTLGTRKKTDILIDNGTKMLRIQVKAKQINRWNCGGVFGEDIILVLVDYYEKCPYQRSDFYILTSEDWSKFVRRSLRDDIKAGKVILNDENCPTWPAKIEGKRDHKGCDVYPKDIAEHKEKWQKIENILKARV